MAIPCLLDVRHAMSFSLRAGYSIMKLRHLSVFQHEGYILQVILAQDFLREIQTFEGTSDNKKFSFLDSS